MKENQNNCKDGRSIIRILKNGGKSEECKDGRKLIHRQQSNTTV
jgi:hypothetical protein